MATKCLPRLREIRIERGLTRDQLADMVPCDELTIRRAEGAIRGAYGLHLSTAVLIADALDASVDDLLGRVPRRRCNTVKAPIEAVRKRILAYDPQVFK